MILPSDDAFVDTTAAHIARADPATLLAQWHNGLRIAHGAGVLAALQTFLGFEQRAAKHREVAAAYGTLRRELETGMAFPDESAKLSELLDGVRTRWDALDATAPATSRRIYEAATRAVVGAQDGRPLRGA